MVMPIYRWFSPMWVGFLSINLSAAWPMTSSGAATCTHKARKSTTKAIRDKSWQELHHMIQTSFTNSFCYLHHIFHSSVPNLWASNPPQTLKGVQHTLMNSSEFIPSTFSIISPESVKALQRCSTASSRSSPSTCQNTLKTESQSTKVPGPFLRPNADYWGFVHFHCNPKAHGDSCFQSCLHSLPKCSSETTCWQMLPSSLLDHKYVWVGLDSR